MASGLLRCCVPGSGDPCVFTSSGASTRKTVRVLWRSEQELIFGSTLEGILTPQLLPHWNRLRNFESAFISCFKIYHATNFPQPGETSSYHFSIRGEKICHRTGIFLFAPGPPCLAVALPTPLCGTCLEFRGMERAASQLCSSCLRLSLVCVDFD